MEQALRGTPSKLAFRALCGAVEEDQVPHCDEQLASWPDGVREAPWSWVAALESGFTTWVWPLVRSLDLWCVREGLRNPAFPDPRLPEMRAVTSLALGYLDREHLEAFTETADHWENLRSVRFPGLVEDDADVLARLARKNCVARLESLVLVNVTEDLWHFRKPSFRLDQTTHLRHIGVMASDLAHLLREGLAPELRSAEVLVSTAGEARDLASCPELASLERLEIGFRCGRNGRQPLTKPFFGNVIEADDEACVEFFSRADLRNLCGLRVRGTRMGLGREGLGARGVEAILPVVPQLSELTLELLPVDDKSIAAVVGAVDNERIEKLVLSDLVATDHVADAFAGVFPRLRHLDLSANHLGAQGVRRVLDSELPALEHLELSGRGGGSPHYGRPELQPLGDGGAMAVASASLAQLKTLRLSATGLGPDGLASLLPLDGLEDLDVSGNPMGSLPDVPGWGSLRTVNLADCGLGDADLALLPGEAPLVSLSLAYNNFSSDGARALAEWPVLPQLWMLDLHDHTIGDDGLAAFAASRAAQRLVELDLEQDVWNARRRSFLTALPAEVFARESFPSVDAMFLGIIDEYHGARYTTGVRDLPADARPELVVFLDQVEIEEDDEIDEDPPPREEQDFRTHRAEIWAELVADAQEFARRMMSGEIGWPP